MTRKRRAQRLIALQPNHIVCRGNNQRRLFSYPRDYLAYLRLLASATKNFGCAVHALCLMSNHVHLLITPETVNAASDAMQSVNQRYAQFRNRQHGSSGKLFEQRFDSEPVKNASHLMFCVLYINGNPHGAGLSNSANYRWSTQALHCGHKSKVVSDDMITFDSWYASLGSSKRQRAEQYKSHFASYRAGKVDAEHLERALRMESKPAKGRPIRPDGSCAAETNHKYGE